MMDLLAADFARLIKSQIFKGVIIFCIESIIFEVIISYVQKNLNKDFMDQLLTTNFIVFGVLVAVFVGLYIGSEYSDGTMRNKIVAGNSRAAVYFSSFIVCVMGGAVLQLTNLILIVSISLGFFGPYSPGMGAVGMGVGVNIKKLLRMHYEAIIEKQLIGFFLILVYTALFLLVSTMIASKSGATAVSMVLAIAIFAAGSAITYKLEVGYDPNDTEETTSITETSDTPQDYQLQYRSYFQQKNKKLQGTKLKVFLFLNDYLPSCQAQAMTKSTVNTTPKNSDKYALYDFSTAVILTAAGMVLFKHKDLK